MKEKQNNRWSGSKG